MLCSARLRHQWEGRRKANQSPAGASVAQCERGSPSSTKSSLRPKRPGSRTQRPDDRLEIRLPQLPSSTFPSGPATSTPQPGRSPWIAGRRVLSSRAKPPGGVLSAHKPLPG